MASSIQRNDKKSPDGIPKTEELLEAYRVMLSTTFLAALIVILILAWALLHYREHLHILPVVIFAGVLGAFFSSLIRLYGFESLPKALLGKGLGLHSWYLCIYALIPPAIGAIAATILYFVFASGLLEGTLLPKFGCDEGAKCGDLSEMFKYFGPQGADSYSKSIVWGFLAGFTERLVPDLLGQLAKSEKFHSQSK